MGGCCENADHRDGLCKRHRRELAERSLRLNLALPLGHHRVGGIFTPDGTGGGTLAWVEYQRPAGIAAIETGFEFRPVLREIRKEALRD